MPFWVHAVPLHQLPVRSLLTSTHCYFCPLQIFEALGTPNDSVWTGVERLAHYRTNFPKWQQRPWSQLVPRLAADALGLNLLSSMLAYNPEARITAGQALKHAWFDEVRRQEALAGGGAGRGRPVPAAQMQPQVRGGSSAAAAAGTAAAAGQQQLGGGDPRLLQYGVRAVQQQQQALAQRQQQVLAQQRQQLQQQVAHQQQVAVLQQAALSQPQLQLCGGFGVPAGLPQGVLLQPASSAAAAGVWPNLPLNALPPAAPQHLPQPQLHHPLQA
jgi:hypothetical protein